MNAILPEFGHQRQSTMPAERAQSARVPGNDGYRSAHIVRPSVAGVGDLLDQFDDTAAKLGIGDAGERARQRQAFGGREKIGNIGRRRAFAEALASQPSRSGRRRTGTTPAPAISRRSAADGWRRPGWCPFSYFCTCWKVRPSASPSFSWLMPSMMRRMRTRLPTYLSTGLGALVDICKHSWRLRAGDEAGGTAVCLRRRYRQIQLGGSGTTADNLSKAA
mgnify:CR=1 FL=1